MKRLIPMTILLLFFLPFSTAYAETIPPHKGWDELWRELMIDIGVIGLVFAAATIYLIFRYRRKRNDETGSAPGLSPVAALGWVLIPLFVFMADDIFMGLKNWDLWDVYRDFPKDAYTVNVETYTWGYTIRYPEGITTRNELRVPAGRPIRVNLTSRDVIHTFFAPAFHVKWDALPGKVQSLWFYPEEVGEYVFTCTEYCGLLHSKMFGKIVVMPKDEFSRWLAMNAPAKVNESPGIDTGEREKPENISPLEEGGKDI